MRRCVGLITSGNFSHHPLLLFTRSSSSSFVPQTLTPDESPIQISNPSAINPTTQLHLILSNPNWPENPSLTSLIPSLSYPPLTSLVSSKHSPLTPILQVVRTSLLGLGPPCPGQVGPTCLTSLDIGLLLKFVKEIQGSAREDLACRTLPSWMQKCLSHLLLDLNLFHTRSTHIL